MNALRHRLQNSARAIPITAALLTLFSWGASGVLWPPLEAIVKLRPIMAVGLWLSCLSLWIWTRRPLSPASRLAAQTLGAVVFAIGLFGFIEQLSSGHLQFTSLLQGDVGRMQAGSTSNWLAPQATLSFIFLGLALALLDWRVQRMISPAEYCLFVVAALAFMTFLRYGYDEAFFSPDPSLKYRMRASAALILMLLAWGGLCACPKGGTMLVFTNTSPTARMLRRVLLLVAIALPLLGWAQLIQERRGWHPPEFGVALLVVSSLSVFVFAVLILGAGLIKAEILQRRAEQHQWRRDAYFSTTFQQADVGLAHVATNGRFLLTNPHLSSILGYSAEELKGLKFQDISYAPDLSRDLHLLQQALEGSRERYSTDKRYRHKDGHLVWCHITASLLRARDGKPKYFVTVIEDITESKHIQEELESASKAKDRFLSIISHELRTPLTPVLAALTGNDPSGTPPDLNNPATIAMLRRNIEHEASIINDLLDLTRITSSASLKLELRPVDMHRLIREVFEGLSSTFREKKLNASYSLEATPHTVMGDNTRLRQILLNLLDNAVKFTPEGGTITLRSTTRPHDPASAPPNYWHNAPPPEADLVITLTDTGEGIDAGQLETIFNPFEQGSRNRERRIGGLGLGLAIVKGFIEAHGGRISAQSPGRGAEFTFTLPLASNMIREPVVAPPPLLPPGEAGCHILLVEDHADTRFTLQRLLQRRGHFVESVETSEEALDLARRQHPPFDLIISDIGLPGGSGLNIPSGLRAMGLTAPCIALSGFGSEEDTRKSLQAGFLLHLTKPVEMTVLNEAIHKLRHDRPRENAPHPGEES